MSKVIKGKYGIGYAAMHDGDMWICGYNDSAFAREVAAIFAEADARGVGERYRAEVESACLGNFPGRAKGAANYAGNYIKRLACLWVSAVSGYGLTTARMCDEA
jgi:hypothetical protein